MENGNPIERKTWFPDIEPLFKLLSYENVPPYLKVGSSLLLYSLKASYFCLHTISRVLCCFVGCLA